MSVIHAPLSTTGPSRAAVAEPTVRAMGIGQYLIAVVLTAVSTIRALGDGAAPVAALIPGLAFLAWYAAGTVLASTTRPRRLAVWWLVGLLAIWIAAVVVSAEFVWLSFLMWLLAGHILPLRWGVAFSGLVLAVVVAAPIGHGGTTNGAGVFGPLIGGAFAVAISRGYVRLVRDAAEREQLVASLTRAQEEMADLQDELAFAQRRSGAIAERTRLSRDIHDTIAQALSSIRLLAHAGAGHVDDPDAVRTLSQIEALAGDSLADVRRIVAALAPVELEDDALAAALRRMLDRVRDEAAVEAELHVDESLPILPTEVEVALLRTAQSALANVRLHSGASRVVVTLIDAGDTVRLDIVDDGSGFDPSAGESATVTSGYGLRFMRARLRELGGGLDVESAPGEGAAISVHLPIHTDPARATGVRPEREEKS